MIQYEAYYLHCPSHQDNGACILQCFSLRVGALHVWLQLMQPGYAAATDIILVQNKSQYKNDSLLFCFIISLSICSFRLATLQLNVRMSNCTALHFCYLSVSSCLSMIIKQALSCYKPHTCFVSVQWCGRDKDKGPTWQSLNSFWK